MKQIVLLLALLSLTLLSLSGCGVDGEPVPPRTGVTISGTAAIGVAGKL